jgi:carbonic anhydrase
MVGIVFSTTVVCAGGYANPVHWSYSGKSAPEYWGELSSEYALCKTGKNQSPIHIHTHDAYDIDLEPLLFSYYAKSTYVAKEHGVKVAVDPGNFIVVDHIKFKLKQFHFHSPSETMINGRLFPLEAHFVHVSDDGDIAVIAVMFEYGQKNKILEQIFNKTPAIPNIETSLILTPKEIMELIPKNRDYFRYNGSLTTPPCSEGVRWIVMKEPMTLSKSQLRRFKELIPYENNRPVQPINARKILQ